MNHSPPCTRAAIPVRWQRDAERWNWPRSGHADADCSHPSTCRDSQKSGRSEFLRAHRVPQIAQSIRRRQAECRSDSFARVSNHVAERSKARGKFRFRLERREDSALLKLYSKCPEGVQENHCRRQKHSCNRDFERQSSVCSRGTCSKMDRIEEYSPERFLPLVLAKGGRCDGEKRGPIRARADCSGDVDAL